jgi:hypothetical protein
MRAMWSEYSYDAAIASKIKSKVLEIFLKAKSKQLNKKVHNTINVFFICLSSIIQSPSQ